MHRQVTCQNLGDDGVVEAHRRGAGRCGRRHVRAVLAARIAHRHDHRAHDALQRAALGAARGVYLLACPRTREHYVGSADGADGFFGRWMDYVTTGHGGNAGMRIRDPSDYLVSVLEVAGSTAGRSDILAMEEAWKRKLMSRSIGLNKN